MEKTQKRPEITRNNKKKGDGNFKKSSEIAKTRGEHKKQLNLYHWRRNKNDKKIQE